MEIKLELDLPGMVSQAVSAERLQPLLNDAIAKAVKSAIEAATSYNSEFRAKLEEQMKAALPHGLGADDVVKFQHVLNTAMATVVNIANNGTVAQALRKAVEDVLPNVPAVVKLSDLMKMARDGLHVYGGKPYFAKLEPTEYGTRYLYLDGDEQPGGKHTSYPKNYAKYQLAINKEGEVYSLKLRGDQVLAHSLPDIVGSFDATLMAFYVGRSRLHIDIDSHDVEWAASAQYDD